MVKINKPIQQSNRILVNTKKISCMLYIRNKHFIKKVTKAVYNSIRKHEIEINQGGDKFEQWKKTKKKQKQKQNIS